MSKDVGLHARNRVIQPRTQGVKEQGFDVKLSKNKVNIRYQKSLTLKSKLKPKTNNYVVQDI